MKALKYIIKIIITAFFISACVSVYAQHATLSGQVTSDGQPVEFANVYLKGSAEGAPTDSAGFYKIENIPAGTHTVIASSIGYKNSEDKITLGENEKKTLNLELDRNSSVLSEVVISGTMKEVSRLDSPVPVEVYSANFFKSNPTPSVFEAIQNVNGVRPQINCSVCNTGDIHINGLEGPYAMILIDGMPIVSGLSTVYGLFGIPQSLIERVEVVKGPASTLYGSEAVGGLVNVITTKPSHAPVFSGDVFSTSWGEVNSDLAGKFNIGSTAQSMVGLNYFNYSFPEDHNNDGFTDVTLQHRISVFNKWNFDRKDSRVFSLAARYIYEDRWGGDMDWSRKYRGSDEVYGESIYTNRWEVFGTYQLPLRETVMLQFSANGHDQNSVYGDVAFLAKQTIGFGQMTWDKKINRHDLLAGATFRYTYYDDNTPATISRDPLGMRSNKPSHTYLPGIFIQDEIRMNDRNKLLAGIRYDYNSIHGSILTPRLNYKWNSDDLLNILRLSVGNGYRVANIFTEDHAALTGSRQVVFQNELKPETSWNGNINFVRKFFSDGGSVIGIDGSAFYTYFENKIIPDYETDPNKIIYDNLDGYAISKGFSLNLDIALRNGFKLIVGGTLMDVYRVEDEEKVRQLFAERFTGVWTAAYTFRKLGLTVDYTGNVYSPMRLPLLGETDPRSEYSPWWSLQNIQLTKNIGKNIEIYGGVKNLLNWTPNKGLPFIIPRTEDPFDRKVEFDSNGQALITPSNPYGLTFDPSYVYAPNQGIRTFLGINYTLR